MIPIENVRGHARRSPDWNKTLVAARILLLKNHLDTLVLMYPCTQVPTTWLELHVGAGCCLEGCWPALVFASRQQPLSCGSRVVVQMARLQLAPTYQVSALITFVFSRGQTNKSSAYRVC